MCEYLIDRIMMARVNFMLIRKPWAKLIEELFEAILSFRSASGDVLEQVPHLSRNCPFHRLFQVPSRFGMRLTASRVLVIYPLPSLSLPFSLSPSYSHRPNSD